MTLKAMMTLDTRLHADHQLDQLSSQFEHWRQTRSHPHERIPDPLWDQAVALTSTLSASRVAKHLRLGGQRPQTPNRQTPGQGDGDARRTEFCRSASAASPPPGHGLP